MFCLCLRDRIFKHLEKYKQKTYNAYNSLTTQPILLIKNAIEKGENSLQTPYTMLNVEMLAKEIIIEKRNFV
jgi:hypothetical protein